MITLRRTSCLLRLCTPVVVAAGCAMGSSMSGRDGGADTGLVDAVPDREARDAGLESAVNAVDARPDTLAEVASDALDVSDGPAAEPMDASADAAAEPGVETGVEAGSDAGRDVACPVNGCVLALRTDGTFCDLGEAVECGRDTHGCVVELRREHCPAFCENGACGSCASNYCETVGRSHGEFCDGTARVVCGATPNCRIETERTECPGYCWVGVCTPCPENWCTQHGHTSGAYCEGDVRHVCGIERGHCIGDIGRQQCPGLCGAGACIACTQRYWNRFDDLALFDTNRFGSVSFTDGTEFTDFTGQAYVRLGSDRTGTGVSRSLSVVTGAPVAASSVTLSIPFSPATLAPVRVRGWIYNSNPTALDLPMQRAGGTPVNVHAPPQVWTEFDVRPLSTLITGRLLILYGSLPNGTRILLDDLSIETCE